MNIVITMAGLGSRFAEAGYEKPKFMIEAKGKTLFEWSLESLRSFFSFENNFVFVTRSELHARPFILEKCDKLGLKNVTIVELDAATDGQATTAFLGIAHCDVNSELLIYNIDTYIEPGQINRSILKGDGSIPCFHADGTHWSFVREEGGKVVEVVEKQRISDNCSLGVYYFKSCRIFNDFYSRFVKNDQSNREKYIAPMYQYMIDEGLTVTYSLIEPNKVHVLGTPEELQSFLQL